jgi:hypothetical protein
MEDRAERQSSATTGKFSKLDWPTPEMLRAAHRLRGEALLDMALTLRSWLKRRAAPPILAASRPPKKQTSVDPQSPCVGPATSPITTNSLSLPQWGRQPSVTLQEKLERMFFRPSFSHFRSIHGERTARHDCTW